MYVGGDERLLAQFNLSLGAIGYFACCDARQPRIAATIRLGENTAMRAFKSVEGMDKLGPAYLMARETAAESVNTLTIGLMLLFMEVVVV